MDHYSISKEEIVVDDNYLSLIGNKVRLILNNESTVTGFVYSIDPTSRSFLLLQVENEEINNVLLVLQNSIESCYILPVEDDKEKLFAQHLNNISVKSLSYLIKIYNNRNNNNKNNENEDDNESIKEKENKSEIIKEKLITILSRQNIPFVIENNIFNIMNKSVIIKPPYLPNSCQSSNEIILKKIRTLIEEEQEDIF
eukprot:TRINITY_DN7509_c0_g1_i1.p1 TRINITY_DN7509_c0_g1~~TRINITY_DN7509_c0_g1_i1.p1  ORF type:complete len:198 (+),score=32.22 TRINITY_DN7509_c0_g1_i1:105-698(+)